MIKIISTKPTGYRRGGASHPAGEAEYPEDQFTEDQLALIENDPALSVTHVPEAQPSKTEPAPTEPTQAPVDEGKSQEDEAVTEADEAFQAKLVEKLEGKPEILSDIILAIGQLPKDGFNKDASPKVAAIEKALADKHDKDAITKGLVNDAQEILQSVFEELVGQGDA